MSQPFDITIPAGEWFFLEITLKESTLPNALPINLTGFTAAAQLREDWDKPLLAEFTVTFPIPRTSGELRVMLTGEQTSALPVNRARYDVFITDPYGNSRKLVGGIASIERLITRT
jgi:hypothetical protein